MTDLLAQMAAFEETIQPEETEDTRDQKIDYIEYIRSLELHAANILRLEDGQYVILKPVYLHKDGVRKIHSLVYSVCINGKRYSARLKRRLSLGLRDRETDRWKSMLYIAHEKAMEMPPAGLDPKLEGAFCWRSSNKDHLKMTFQHQSATVVINATKVVEASGDMEDVVVILQELKKWGI